MRRIFALLLIVGLLAAACSSKRPTPDEGVAESSEAESRVAAEELPLSVPDRTFMLLRMDVAQMDTAMSHIAEMIGVVRAVSFESEHPSKRMLAAMLSRPFQWSQRIGGDSPEDAFPGLDASGTAFAAFSTVGNERLLRALENGVPGYGSGMIPRGFFVRLHLPATEPEVLRAWLEAECGSMLACDSRQALEAREGAVVMDYRMGDIPQILERAGESAELPTPGEDAWFADRDSPALRAFVDTEAALGAYVVSERLVDLGALVGMTEARDALENAAPGMRDALYTRGMAIAGDVYLLQSRGSREVADSAAFLRVSEAFGFTLDAVRSLTEQGARVSEASATDTGVSSITVEQSAVSAELSYNLAGAMDAAVAPDWLDSSDDEAMKRMADIIRSGGIWPNLIASHNYPIGFAKGMHTFAESAGFQYWFVGLARHFRGVRLALEMKPIDAGQSQTAPGGGLAVVFDAEADVQGYIAQLRAMVDRQIPVPLMSETVDVEGGREGRVWAGEGVEFGDAAPVDGVMRLSMDMAAIAESMRGIDGSSSQRDRILADVFEKFARVDLEAQRAEHAAYARLTVAGSKVPRIEPAAAAVSGLQTEAPPACIDEARSASHEAFSKLDSFETGDRDQVVEQILEELERIEATCEEGRDDVRWMRAQWLIKRGVGMVERFDWDQAKAAFSKSCELEGVKTCRWVERLGAARDASPLASVPYAEPSGRSTAIEVTLTESTLRTGRFASVMGRKSGRTMDLDEVSWSDETTLRQAQDFMDMAEHDQVFYLAVSPDAHASVLSRLVAMSVSKKRERRRRLLGQDPGQTPPVHLPVQVDGGDVGGLTFYPVAKLPEPAIRIELGESADVDLEAVAAKVRALDGDAHVAIVVDQGVRFGEVATLASRVLQASEAGDVEIRLSLETR